MSNLRHAAHPFHSFQLGEDQGVRYYFELHQVTLYQFICRCLNREDEDAKDILMQVFTIAYEKRTRINDEVHLEQFLFFVARKRCLSKLILERRDRLMKNELVHRQQADSRELTEEDRVMLLEKLRKDIEKLPRQRRLAIKLRYLQGKTVKYIAALLHLKEQTVRNHLAAGLHDLGAKKISRKKNSPVD